MQRGVTSLVTGTIFSGISTMHYILRISQILTGSHPPPASSHPVLHMLTYVPPDPIIWDPYAMIVLSQSTANGSGKDILIMNFPSHHFASQSAIGYLKYPLLNFPVWSIFHMSLSGRYKRNPHVFPSMPITLNQEAFYMTSDSCSLPPHSYAAPYTLSFLHHTSNCLVWSYTSHRRRHRWSQDCTKGNRPHETHFPPVVGSYSWKASLQGKFGCLWYVVHCIPIHIDLWQISETTPGVNQVSGYGDISASKSLWYVQFILSPCSILKIAMI